MGDPEFKIRDLIKREKVKVFSSNYALYGDMGNRVVSALGSMVPTIETYYGADARNDPATRVVGRAGPREKGTVLESDGQTQRYPRARYGPHPRCRSKGRRLEAQGRASLPTVDDTMG